MNYEQFAAEYRRLFALMVKGVSVAQAMADLSESVPAEWVERVENEG